MKNFFEMTVSQTDIQGLLIIEPQIFEDARGYFSESFNARDFAAATGLDINFVQDNESRSNYGVLRGLHFQRAPYQQSKLVRVIEGKVLDVVVDLRKDSSSFGKWFSILLSSENHLQLFIPKGFAHGYCVLSETALFQYKCDEFYHPEAEDGLIWNDPDIAVEWGVPEDKLILSEKDKCRASFKEICKYL